MLAALIKHAPSVGGKAYAVTNVFNGLLLVESSVFPMLQASHGLTPDEG